VIVRSLTNRLRLTWLTVVALAACAVVWLVGPDGMSVARVVFAGDVTRFTELVSPPGEQTIRFETITLLRAHFAADMMFLVAYGLVLRASIRILSSTPLAWFAPRGPIVVMIADAAENLFALSILRRLGEGISPPPPWWFGAMNAAAAAKWLAAGVVLLCLAIGWRREAREGHCYGPLPWLIAGGFAVGGVASLAVTSFALSQPGWLVPAALIAPAMTLLRRFAVASVASLAVTGFAFSLPGWLVPAALISPAIALLLQLRLLATGKLMLRFLNLSRAPLIILLFLAAFGPLALGPAVALLGGIMVAGNIIGMTVTTAAAIAVLFACGTQINIVRAYASERVQDESLRDLDHPVLARCVFWTGVVAAASLLFSVGLVSLSLKVWQIAAGIVLGTMGMLLLLFVIEWIAAWLSIIPKGYPLPELAVPFRRITVLAMLLNQAADASPPRLRQYFADSFVARKLGTASGYVESLPKGRRRILPGHAFATIQFVLTFVVFWVALYFKSHPIGPFYTQSLTETDAAFLAPTVTSILLLFLLSGWVFAAVAFFFDRYRIPVFTIAIIAALTTGAWSRTDYRVPTSEKNKDKHYPLATPGQVLKAFGNRPLVVAATGGGIQAGAWTARVLSGLDQSLHGTLRQRVALISSVSGGSMGALYYGAFEDEPTLDHVVQQALKPSLDEVATAFVGRDIFAVLGLRLGTDRGAALEDTWERRLGDVPRSSLTLRSWSEAARDFALGAGRTKPFPAFLFNSTVVESGQPIVFATTQFPTRSYTVRIGEGTSTYPTVESANSLLGLSVSDSAARDIGLKAVTAARLSAAFPYVSPAARLDGLEPYHLVDGGYYDFYGLVALCQWVDDALEELRGDQQLPDMIGVVIARGLVYADTALRDDDDDAPAEPVARTMLPKGWRWQLTAPLATALHASMFAQWARGMQTLRLLIEKWAQHNVVIIPRLFDYPGGDRRPVCQGAPLSWKLTAPQQDCIETAWEAFASDPLKASLR
jgi:Patatin-like phospholipase